MNLKQKWCWPSIRQRGVKEEKSGREEEIRGSAFAMKVNIALKWRQDCWAGVSAIFTPESSFPQCSIAMGGPMSPKPVFCPAWAY